MKLGPNKVGHYYQPAPYSTVRHDNFSKGVLSVDQNEQLPF